MRSALGKGLDALISEETVADVAAANAKPQTPTVLQVDRIRANPKQPRQTYSEASLADLVTSVQQKGILQPIIVAPVEGGIYEIIAGERRYRAALKAGLKEVPVVLRSGGESEAERFELALIENLQREDLNPIDLALGFKRLQEEFQLTQEAIAQIVGKDRTVVANTLRLLGLPAEIQQALKEGKITAGHARALVAIEDPAAQKDLFDRIQSDELTVRHVEEAARDQKKSAKKAHLQTAGYDAKPAEVRALEEELQRTLTRKVEIHSNASHKGSIKLEFYSLDDFDQLVKQLKNASPTHLA